MDLSVENPALLAKTLAHPCYGGGCQNARMHLPVAPACNISCNYCNRRFDCVNESRPGVTSEVLTPEQACAKFAYVRSKIDNLKVVGIAGPGDALANFPAVCRTFELIREIDPGITFCLSTNGLCLPQHLDDLLRLGVTHITLTINTIDPKIGARIYREVTLDGQRYGGEEGAGILLRRQIESLSLLAEKDIVTKVNTVLIKGINDTHIVDVAKKIREYGVYLGNIMQLIPASGSAFEQMPLTSLRELNEVRTLCEPFVKQMYHCRQCRADAIGSLDQDRSAEFRGCGLRTHMGSPETPIVEQNDELKKKRLVAVTTKDGKLINQHFGHADRLSIWAVHNGQIRFIENRDIKKYCLGAEDCRESESKISSIANVLSDCEAVFTQRMGFAPQRALESSGLKVIQTYGLIEEELAKFSCTKGECIDE